MTEFKEYETYNVNLSEISSACFKVPEEKKAVITEIVTNMISDILLMRPDTSVEFSFNLNRNSIYLGFTKSYPFLKNNFHEFIYPLDNSKKLSDVIDETMDEAVYYKTALPIDDFKDFFVNIKAFDELFNFNGELYSFIKKSSFYYTNIGFKDVFNGINIVRIFGNTPGVRLDMNGVSANINNNSWNFEFDGLSICVKNEQICKPEGKDCIKKTLISFYNLSKGTNINNLDSIKFLD